MTAQNKVRLGGFIVILCAGLIIYYPGLAIGFMGDDWDFLRSVIQTPPTQLIVNFFNPLTQFMWYRPLIGLLWLADYEFFGVNPWGYHLAAILIHLLNSILLARLVTRVTQKTRVGFVSALIYVGFALASQSIFWMSDPQIFAETFCLLTLGFWLSYLETKHLRDYAFAFVGFTAALLSKENSLPWLVILFLADRLLQNQPISRVQLFKRYAPLVFLVALYLGSTLQVLTQGMFHKQMGYGIDWHVLYNLTDYLSLLAFPWKLDAPFNYFWLALVTFLLIGLIWSRKNKRLVFLGLTAILLLATVLPFPRTNSAYAYLNPRYTYGGLMVSAILLASLAEWLWLKKLASKYGMAILAAGLAILVGINGLGTQNAAAFWAETSRLERLPFRNIAARHPTFPQDTYLYFVDAWSNFWSTMFLARYGNHVSTSDIFTQKLARLRDHQNPIIISMDAQGNSQEFTVEKNSDASSSLPLPANFGGSIRLVDYEIASTHLRPGDTLIVLLYWQAIQKIDHDYTVFVHLVDANGNTLEGHDSQPRDGTTATSLWLPNEINPDGILIHIPDDANNSPSYHLEIGLYDLPTMQRLNILDANGNPITNQLTIAPIQIDR